MVQRSWVIYSTLFTTLYKPTHRDVGIISNHPHPPLMPSPMPRRPPSPSVENSQPHSTRLQFNALKRDRDHILHSVPEITWQKQEFNPERIGRYESNDYKQIIVGEFNHHQIFVDVDDSMEHVLHVPKDWKTQWALVIRDVKLDQLFHLSYLHHSNECETHGTREGALYQPLMDMINAILGVTYNSLLGDVEPKTPQRYTRNVPKKLHHGVPDEAQLSLDIIALHKDLCYNPQPNEVELSNWAHPPQVMEVKPFDAALVDGSYMPRLKVDGKPQCCYPKVLWMTGNIRTGPEDQSSAN